MASKNYFSAPRGFQSRTSSTPKASDPLAGWGSNAEMQNRLQKEKLANDAAASKQTEQEMVMRSVYGAAGEHPGESYDARINEELKNPAQPETEAEANFRKKPMTYDMMKTVLTRKPATPKAPKASTDYTEQLIAELNTYQPGYKIQTGKNADGAPIYEIASPERIFRSGTNKYKNYNPKDPRIQDWYRQFVVNTPVEKPQTSTWDRIKTVASAAGGATKRGAETVMHNIAPPQMHPSPAAPSENPAKSFYPDAVKLKDGTWGTQIDGKWHRITQK